jgi:hypothetical protein
MRAKTSRWTVPSAVRAAALAALLAAATGACEHTGSLEPRSPRPAPIASVESGEMEALLVAWQREARAQGPADAAREQLIAALFAATREPASHSTVTDRPATAVPAHVEKGLAALFAAQGDSATMVKALQELMDRDGRTP